MERKVKNIYICYFMSEPIRNSSDTTLCASVSDASSSLLAFARGLFGVPRVAVRM